MRILARSASHPHRTRRLTAVASAAIALAALGAPAAMPAPDAGLSGTLPAAQAQMKKSPAPFLFQYTFNRHLKVGGGYFTVGGRVTVLVKLNNGTVMYRQTVTAQTHPITPGGAIYVETTVASPCGGGGNNGYAQAYDHTTRTWSPRLPVPVCVRFD